MASPHDAQRNEDKFLKKHEFIRATLRLRELIFTHRDNNRDTQLRWITAIRRLGEKYNIPVVNLNYTDRTLADPERRQKLLDDIDKRLADIQLDILVEDAINGSYDYIELTNDWKDRASSYVVHIRDVVTKADLAEGLRERIFKRLNDLQSEIDRNRTRVESITEVFLSVTEAVSKGAKHLDGAVKLVERLAGALSGARSAQIEHDTQLRLPPPDNLGLSNPE